MKKAQPDRQCRARRWTSLQFLQWAALMAAMCCFTGCATLKVEPTAPENNARQDPFALADTLFIEGHYEAALKENQRLLGEKKAAPDVALFNIGLISASSSNPKRDYPRALNSFKTLTFQYPQSPLTEPARIWIQAIEERQRAVDERQKLLEEKRFLTREREALSEEVEKQKYIAEKSRQVDLEIEKRRRQRLR